VPDGSFGWPSRDRDGLVRSAIRTWRDGLINPDRLEPAAEFQAEQDQCDKRGSPGPAGGAVPGGQGWGLPLPVTAATRPGRGNPDSSAGTVMYQDLREHEDLIAAHPAVAALASGGRRRHRRTSTSMRSSTTRLTDRRSAPESTPVTLEQIPRSGSASLWRWMVGQWLSRSPQAFASGAQGRPHC
jgi:hypothetical protein